MEALMRARDIATQHALAEATARRAQAHVPSAAASVHPDAPATLHSEHAITQERDASSPTASPA
eukprot:3539900-Pleurochrysis_carterae.AAC.1